MVFIAFLKVYMQRAYQQVWNKCYMSSDLLGIQQRSSMNTEENVRQCVNQTIRRRPQYDGMREYSTNRRKTSRLVRIVDTSFRDDICCLALGHIYSSQQ
jgi:hypothetical protein